MIRKLLCIGAIGAMMNKKWGRCGPGGGAGGPFSGPFWRESPEGGRTRRGDIKFQILDLLTEKPRHGYDVIRDLEERAGGLYRPSAGSIYPTLQMLEDGGYVTSEQVTGKKVYTITAEGRGLLDQRPPSETRDDQRADGIAARQSAVKLAGAVMQALRSGDGAVVARVKQILDRGRKEIYSLLADEDEHE
jgi:DNA-binding PadR family transcriptional regulator